MSQSGCLALLRKRAPRALTPALLNGPQAKY